MDVDPGRSRRRKRQEVTLRRQDGLPPTSGSINAIGICEVTRAPKGCQAVLGLGVSVGQQASHCHRTRRQLSHQRKYHHLPDAPAQPEARTYLGGLK